MLDRSSNSDLSASALLGSLLRDLRPARASYCRTQVARPWGIRLPFEEGIRFHFVAEGQCWVLVEGTEAEQLNEGDVVLLPHGTRHAIADHPLTALSDIGQVGPVPISNTCYRIEMNGGGAASLIFCCTVGFDEPLAHQLIGSMPILLVVRSQPARPDALRLLLDVMAAEMTSERLGSATVMARLADAAIGMILRQWSEDSQNIPSGWLAAMRDPALGRVLVNIHTRPDQSWTVERLAGTAAMSRSAFVERFTAVLGMPPARYIAEWRMRQARALLRSGRLPVAEVAARLGYASEAAFSRAFKRLSGSSPGSFRDKQLQS